LDRARIEQHARAQHARGGRTLAEPKPPPALALGPATRTATPLTGAPRPPFQADAPDSVQLSPGSVHSPSSPRPAPTAVSHAELVDFDAARRVRWLPVARSRAPAAIGPSDRDLLAWLVAARCALSSQIHRRFNAPRSLTTTQRTLKHLADAGLIARFQLFRDDGGGVPLCCAATGAAIELLGVRGRRAAELGDGRLAALRRDVHLVGWLLALEAVAGGAVREVLGPGRAAIAPGAPGPAELRLDRGLRPREFLVTGRDGSRLPVERFAVVRPDAVVALAGAAHGAERDLLVLLDGPRLGAVLEAADHLVSGWWRSVERFRRGGAPPAIVVVCRDEAAAGARLALADGLLGACLAEIGVPAERWRRPGRSGICFASEAELHGGSLAAWTVPPLPPGLRASHDGAPVRVELVQPPVPGAASAAKPRWC
jgi:hypothetical protein